MSDHHHEEPNNPVGKIVSGIFLIAVPGALIVMLAVTGFAFVNNMKAPPVPEVEKNEPKTPENPGGDPTSIVVAKVSPAKAYESCATCHAADGKGLPVGGNMLMAPSLVGSELLLHENPEVPLLIAYRGILKQGNETLGVMAPLGGTLTDEQIAAAITYARTNFGNSASKVTTEQAAAARAKFGGTPMIKRDDILKIVEDHK